MKKNEKLQIFNIKKIVGKNYLKKSIYGLEFELLAGKILKKIPKYLETTF